jgi:hypothetical protein
MGKRHRAARGLSPRRRRRFHHRTNDPGGQRIERRLNTVWMATGDDLLPAAQAIIAAYQGR